MPKSYTIVEMINRNADAAKDGLLTRWETEFSASMVKLLERANADSNVGFSGKQLEWIDRIHEKVLRLEAGDD